MHEKYGKVGIGVITAGAREIKDYKLSQGCDFYVYLDKEKKGPAHSRNKILQFYEGYDHIFCFDDDAWPLLTGWVEYFIEQALKHDVHFMAIPEYFSGKVIGCVDEMVEWNASLAAITYYSKKCVETVGGYNQKYGRWGHEDIAYAHRCVNKAGLSTRPGAYCFPLRGLAYIYYSDAYGTTGINNFSNEEKEYYRELYHPIFDQEIKSDQIYYEFREEKIVQ